MKAGFEVYLKEKGNKLGGQEVKVVTADEGETADTGKAAADKLVKQDKAAVVTGVVSSATMNGIVDLFETSQIPLVGSNASPTTLTGKKFIWRTSYVNDEPGKALGAYVAKKETGPVYLLAADYQAGKDETGGFKESFTPAGGKVADEVYTPFPGTKNFQPFLANLQKSGAKSVFTFYAGGAAVDFVKQYDQFGLAGKVTHYSAGFLTEGGVLTAQGKSALGTRTAMNYSADLDNPVNMTFVAAYQSATGKLPTTYAMASYDAARGDRHGHLEGRQDRLEVDQRRHRRARRHREPARHLVVQRQRNPEADVVPARGQGAGRQVRQRRDRGARRAGLTAGALDD